jgi:outer membrane protein OmpA-like peptidoglycan-associated protein
MGDSRTSNAPNQSRPTRPPLDGLSELRDLLLTPEQDQLRELQARVANLALLKPSSEDVGRVLPAAIARRPKPDAQLTQVLTPTVEAALKTSVNKDPQTLVDAIFPVIGPAIRKAIIHTLSDMIQSLNQTLEYSLSLRSLRWRWTAWRTGKSYAEVVLLHTLLYRVEQVFLIHRHTGLLLQHVAADVATALDPDVVAGMLTAIQDFVRDSFSLELDETLDTFRVGELVVWVEQGPRAILAAVIRGNPAPEVRSVLQEALEMIHLEHSSALEAFEGNPAPFTASRPRLTACLMVQPKTRAKTCSPVLGMALGLVLLGCGWWVSLAVREQRRWSAYVQRLEAEPGIVVTATTKRRGTYLITGLRDPLAIDPVSLLQERELASVKVIGQWKPYQSFHPAFVLIRARHVLQPPDTVTLRLEDGSLYATGSAPHQWIAEARKLARAIPGIRGYHDDRLVDADTRTLETIKALLAPPDTVTLQLEHGVLSALGTAPHAWIVAARRQVRSIPNITQFREDALVDRDMRALTAQKARVETYLLHFARGTTQLVPDQDDRLQALLADVQGLYTAAQTVGQRVYLNIVGHTDTTGSEAANQRLSQERAERILALLVSHGFEAAHLTATGVGTQEPGRAELTEQDRAFNRRVSFRVILSDEHTE